MTAAPLRPARALLAAVVAASALLTGCLLSPNETRASRGMELALQDDSTFLTQSSKRVSRERAFDYARQLGVTRLRVNMLWSYTMPANVYNARRKPAQVQYLFNAFDSLVDAAARKGIRVHLSLTGPAPRWARPKSSIKQAWYKPNTAEFGKWAGIVAQHFAGRVDRYSIWNEPNWKTWLGPLNSAPATYRQLYSRGYTAIKKADRRAKVLIGETSPFARPGMSTAPLAFLRKVACVDKKYKHRKRSCPKLKADGYAHHPYDFRHSPNFQYPGADNVTIGTLSRLTKGLDKLRKSGALRTSNGSRMPVYLTEYGYFASGHRALPPKQRTRYLQQAYSIALKNSRVKSQLQYLLVSPPRNSDSSFFNLALLSSSGKRYPQFNALQRWYKVNRGKVRRPGRADHASAGAREPGRVSEGPADRRARLRRARLYLVVEAAAEPVLGPALRGGVDMVQLRDKEAPDEEILRAAARFRALCDEHGALFWLNDRPDLARAAGADGVHLGQDDLPVAEARELLGPDLLIGLSTHSPEQFDAALASEADQLSVGPVWETPTKAGRPAAGLDYLRLCLRARR